MAVTKKPVGLVLIHGAGKEPSTYHLEFVAALKEILGKEPQYKATWWSDLCNIGPAVRGGKKSRAQSPEAQEFRRAFLQEMGVKAGTRATRSVGDTVFLLADVANDVVKYLFDDHMRQDIQARLEKDLEKANQVYAHTVLVSHSLGTVVAYDVLRQHASGYNVRTWFTTGCPLAKLVNLRRCTTDIGKIAMPPAERWENLYDASDVVASVLGKAFSYPIRDVRVENGSGIMQSHDYWRNPAVAEIVAKMLKGS